VSGVTDTIEHMFDVVANEALRNPQEWAAARPDDFDLDKLVFADAAWDAGDGGEDPIPAALASMAPGPVLAAWLSAIDVQALSGHDRVVVLQAHQRLVSHHAAKAYEAMAAVAEAIDAVDEHPLAAAESTSAEVRAALRLTRRAADHELALAIDLYERLPRVWQLLATGEIDVRRARVIAGGTGHLSADGARRVVDRVADDAAGLTTGQLAARLRRLCLQADPDEARHRYDDAVTERRVVVEPTPDGPANLMGMDLPPHAVSAGMRRINRLARSLSGPGEDRTIDQLRADVFLDLLQGRDAAGKGGTVDIAVDLMTLAELADAPGELAGYGPVVADIARQVAADQDGSRWQYTVTDGTGRPVSVGVTRRRPTALQQRIVATRNATCVFPGCRMPAVECDVDHRTPYVDGGSTTVDNLAPLCRHDHRLKHGGWRLAATPTGHRWTSLLGHTYTTTPTGETRHAGTANPRAP